MALRRPGLVFLQIRLSLRFALLILELSNPITDRPIWLASKATQGCLEQPFRASFDH